MSGRIKSAIFLVQVFSLNLLNLLNLLSISDDTFEMKRTDYSERRTVPVAIPEFREKLQNGERFVVCVS